MPASLGFVAWAAGASERSRAPCPAPGAPPHGHQPPTEPGLGVSAEGVPHPRVQRGAAYPLRRWKPTCRGKSYEGAGSVPDGGRCHLCGTHRKNLSWERGLLGVGVVGGGAGQGRDL